MNWKIDLDHNRGEKEAILFLSSKLVEIVIWVDKKNVAEILEDLEEGIAEIHLGFCGNEPALIVKEKKGAAVIIGDRESWDAAITLTEKELNQIQKIFSTF